MKYTTISFKSGGVCQGILLLTASILSNDHSVVLFVGVRKALAG